MNSFTNLVSIFVFALLIGGSVYVGLRLVFRAEDSPRTKKIIKISALSAVLLAYLGFGLSSMRSPEEDPVAAAGTLTLESDVDLTVSVEVEEWKQSLDGYGLVWPPTGELAAPGPGVEILGTITGELADPVLTRRATIGIGGGGITGFKCEVEGIEDQAQTAAFLKACWEAAKVSGVNTSSGSEWITEAVAAGFEQESEIIRATETVCPAELTMLSLATADTYHVLTFNIFPSQTDC